MMKKIFTILLSLILGISFFVGCTGPATSSPPDSSGEEMVENTNIDLLKNGKSDYQIVVPKDRTRGEDLAASDLQTFFKQATAVQLPIVEEDTVSYSTTSKFLAVGELDLLKTAGISVDDTALKANGFTIVQKDSSIFFIGGYSFGVLYAVQHFLNVVVDFEIYTIDEIYTKTDVQNLKLPNLNVTKIPDIDTIIPTYPALKNSQVGALRMGWLPRDLYYISSAVDVNGGRVIYNTHNTYEYVPPEMYMEQYPQWFNNHQLCFSQEDMYTIAFLPAMKELIERNPDQTVLTVVQEDKNAWCICPQCKASAEKYGADSATLIKFVNRAARDLKVWMSENYPEREVVSIQILAYHKMQAAPCVKDENGVWQPVDSEVILEDNVFVQLAPIGADWSLPLTHELNKAHYDDMMAWTALTDNISIWGYETNFSHYFVPYDTWQSCQENFKFYHQIGVDMIYSQAAGSGGRGTDWQDLSIYLESKLRWDVDADMSAYIENFFNHVYKDAAKSMFALWNEIRMYEAYLCTLGYNGTTNATIDKEEYWPYDKLQGFMGYINEAYARIELLKEQDIETYKLVHDRITRESIAFRFLLIQKYGARFGVTELYNMKNQFKQDCFDLGILEHKEGVSVNGLFELWGV